MSSRSKKKGGAQKYPTPWSEWVWSDQYQRHYRSRLKGPDDWEYEYDQPENQPRTHQEPSLSPSAPENYPQDKNYTTKKPADLSNVESLTDDFAGASISPGGKTYTSGTYPSATSSGTYSGAPNTGFFPAATSTGTYPGVAVPAYATGPTYGQSGYTAPTTGWQKQVHIQTKDPYTDREAFDPHYKVHGAWAFKFGKIFKVLWAEPKGEGAGSAGQSGTESLTVRKGPGGKDTFAKVRRFVIIKPMDGHCICLPIMTYSGQGVTKSGVHANHHAIIYSGKKPIAFRGEKEKGLEMRSIKVTPDNPRHKLDDASRLNYAKNYTVEYNVKVWFIGKVSSDSEWQIRTDYNRVHPPLEIKGVPPADVPEDTYEHAHGGNRGGYSSYGTGSYPSASYSSGSSYPQTASYASSAPGYSTTPSTSYDVHGTIPEHEHEQESSSATYPSYGSPIASANAPYGGSSTGYDAGAYAASPTAYAGPGTTAAGGYGSGTYGEGDERDYGREHRHGRSHGRGESGSDVYYGGNSRQSGSGTGSSSYGSGTGGPDYTPSTGYEHMDPLAENPQQWGNPEAEVPPPGTRREPSRPRKRGTGPTEHGNNPPDDHRDLYEE